jgi:DDE superfamily endonuclease
MTQRRAIAQVPVPLEEYCEHFDFIFSRSTQRENFRQYLEGLLLPGERNKTLTGLVNTEPFVGAQFPRAQKLQGFLSESTWDERMVQAARLKLLREEVATAPNDQGVLVIDETGDRKAGHKTAHVGRQYLGSVGKIDDGVVSVTSLWADSRVYYPLEVEPYTPEHHFAKGRNDPAFRTKLQIALQLVRKAVEQKWPFRAVVADSFYGEDRGLRRGFQQLKVAYVMALKPSHTWWHPQDVAGSLKEVANAAGWENAQSPGKWKAITRTFRHGDPQHWWVLEIVAGPYGPNQVERAVVATTDPETLPDLTTWYLVTNLPASAQEQPQVLSLAALEEVIRLYGLRQWVEQSDKQVKHVLGWAQYQVRSDQAIRRHWQLVCCAFSFCWYHAHHSSASTTDALLESTELDNFRETDVPAKAVGTGEKINGNKGYAATGVLAGGTADGAGLVGTLDPAVALLESVEQAAPASCSSTPA